MKVETLLSNVSDMREFFNRWVELFERVEHMVVEGEEELWLIDWLTDWSIDWLTDWMRDWLKVSVHEMQK